LPHAAEKNWQRSARNTRKVSILALQCLCLITCKDDIGIFTDFAFILAPEGSGLIYWEIGGWRVNIWQEFFIDYANVGS